MDPGMETASRTEGAIHSLEVIMAATFVAGANSRAIGWGRALIAGIVAMIVFIVIEMAFSWAMRGASPGQPLAVFGTVTLHVLMSPAAAGDGIRTMLVGAALLLALGALSGVVLAYIVDRIGVTGAAVAGAIFGLAMYVADLYGGARLFPVLLDLRDWMSALAYVIQGALTAALYKVMTREDVQATNEDDGHDLRDLRDVRLV
jgi:hypothetical protein